MNRFITALSLLFVTINFTSCGFEEKKKALDSREAILKEREQLLFLKEKQLTLLEDSIRHSIAKQDSTLLALQNLGLPLPDSLQGNWNINMVCTQTNCSGFAVGDTRKETWTFSGGDSVGVYVKAMQGENLIRIYSGIYDGIGFVLSTPNASGESNPTIMNVKLNIDNPNKLTGTRVIKQSDGCSTTFRLEAERPRR